MNRHLKAILAAAAVGVLVIAAGAALGDGSSLAVGDVIAVVVDGEKEFSKNYQIDKDGLITMPMVKPVRLLGLSTSDAAAEITKALTDVLVSPQVTVAFVERARMQVFVVGQVRKPGLVEIGAGDRVIQALAQAGYDETADLSRISIRRGNQSIDVDLGKYLSAEDLSTNIELQSQDTIVVPRVDVVGNVLILGQVEKPGAVPISRGMTFRELMGLVGGVKVEADTEKITVKRGTLADPIRIDYKRAMDGDPQADIALQPGDTIYIPEIETAFFTVMGGVNRPGQYPLKGRLLLTEAVGLAGGPVPNVGDLRKVQVSRQSDGTKPAETLKVDLTKVISGSDNDPVVKRGDVIYVAVGKQKPSVWSTLSSILSLGWIFR